MKQLQDFDKGICQVCVCVCKARRPSGGVSRQKAYTAVLMTLEGYQEKREKREKHKLGNKVPQSTPVFMKLIMFDLQLLTKNLLPFFFF